MGRRFLGRKRLTVVLPATGTGAGGDTWDARPADEPPASGRPDPDPERRKRRRLRRRVLGFVLSVVFLAGTAALLFGERGYLDVRRSRAELDLLQRQVDRELTDVRRLRDEVKRLENDPAAIERIAREELGFAREGEVQILLPRDDEDAVPGQDGADRDPD